MLVVCLLLVRLIYSAQRNINGVLVDEEFSRIMLEKHNTLRSRTASGQTTNQPSATYMNELKWDFALAAAAQKHSETCPGGVSHSSNREQTIEQLYSNHKTWNWDTNQYGMAYQSVGENVDWQPLNGQTLTNDLLAYWAERDWFDEYKDYNFWSDSCSSLCGHYTQMVWADTRAVGCGYANCGGGWVHLVCQYYPSGNYYNRYSSIGYGTQPYYSGNQCSQCNTLAKDRNGGCVNGLCKGCMSPNWNMCNDYFTNCNDLSCPTTQCTMSSTSMMCTSCRDKCNTCSVNDLTAPQSCSENGIDPIVYLTTTKQPTTKNPTTKNPTTQHPTTKFPTTNYPTTKYPTTKNPTNVQTTTKHPTTKEPTTKKPTTLNPTTLKPTTMKPTNAPTNKPLSEYINPKCEFIIHDSSDSISVKSDGYVLMNVNDYNNDKIYHQFVNQYEINKGIKCYKTMEFSDCCMVSSHERIFLTKNGVYLDLTNNAGACISKCIENTNLFLASNGDTLLMKSDTFLTYNNEPNCGGLNDFIHPAIYAKCIEIPTTIQPLTTTTITPIKPLNNYTNPICQFGIYNIADRYNTELINNGWLMMDYTNYNNPKIYNELVRVYNNENGITCLITMEFGDCCIATDNRTFLKRNSEYFILANINQLCETQCTYNEKILFSNYFEIIHTELTTLDQYITFSDNGCGGNDDIIHAGIFARCIENPQTTTQQPITTMVTQQPNTTNIICNKQNDKFIRFNNNRKETCICCVNKQNKLIPKCYAGNDDDIFNKCEPEIIHVNKTKYNIEIELDIIVNYLFALYSTLINSFILTNNEFFIDNILDNNIIIDTKVTYLEIICADLLTNINNFTNCPNFASNLLLCYNNGININIKLNIDIQTTNITNVIQKILIIGQQFGDKYNKILEIFGKQRGYECGFGDDIYLRSGKLDFGVCNINVYNNKLEDNNCGIMIKPDSKANIYLINFVFIFTIIILVFM